MPEPASRLRAAALACLFHHECGGRETVAYRLSFARIGTSGASFGRLQADCHADPAARAALGRILTAAGMASDRIAAILGWLALRMPRGWIGAPADLRDIDAAIAAPSGRAIVDAQDAALLDGLLQQLQHCRQSAAWAVRVLSKATVPSAIPASSATRVEEFTGPIYQKVVYILLS